MTETLFLIAHVVRGTPAFDIAIQMVVQDEDEPWWILPSTGHRAYPYWHFDLEIMGEIGLPLSLTEIADQRPADLPDFYRSPSTPITDPDERRKTMSILETLGLVEPFVRRF